MRKRKKNIKIGLSGFLRYRNGEMKGKERNSFERELQKDSFAEEAVEGFSLISPREAESDLQEIQRSVNRRTHPKQRLIIYRIAAVIAILISVSYLFLTLERNKPSGQLSMESERQEQVEIARNETAKQLLPSVPEEKPAVPERNTKDETIKALKKSPANGNGDISSEKKADEKQFTLREEQQTEITKSETITESEEEISESIVADNSRPKEKVPAMAGKRSAEPRSGLVQFQLSKPGYAPAQPLYGQAEFDRYIIENMRITDSISSGRKVVVTAGFIVQTDGTIDSIRIIRSPDRKFSEEAIRLIKSGPAWKPAEHDGVKVEEEIKVRIVFKR